MRICVVLDCERELCLPVQYNHIVQGFLYNNISDNKYREYLHHYGYQKGKRRFKLFTFSRLLGQFRLGPKGSISFQPPVKLVVSSPLQPFLGNLLDSLLKPGMLFLGKNIVEVKELAIYREVEIGEQAQVKMLSPMVAYSTVLRDDKKYTLYHSPWKQEFETIIRNNLLQKYEIIFGSRPQNESFSIVPNGHREEKCARILNFKGTVIKAYAGVYWLLGNPELIKVAYETGLGSKNSQGFGCWELAG